MTQQTSVQTKAASLNGELALLNGGYINRYSGTQPASTTASLGAAVLLCTNALNATAFATTTTNTATANAITAATAIATGTATFYRAYDSSNICHRQGSVGTADADLIMANPNIIEGGNCTITSWTVTQG